jgi:hypothetical protein
MQGNFLSDEAFAKTRKLYGSFQGITNWNNWASLKEAEQKGYETSITVSSAE